MNIPKNAGAEKFTRPGYYLAGFAKAFRHWKTKKLVVAKDGKVFPIWKKIEGSPTPA